MTIRQALDEKRAELAGKVKCLVLCKCELFYVRHDGSTGDGSPEATVYPVGRKAAAKEAKFFGVPWSEE